MCRRAICSDSRSRRATGLSPRTKVTTTPDPAPHVQLFMHDGSDTVAQPFSFLGPVRRSFNKSVSVVEPVDGSDSIVFASKGRPSEWLAPGMLLRPKTRKSSAADQLMASSTLVTSALKDQNAARRAIPRP